jgi:hypothetical protein
LVKLNAAYSIAYSEFEMYPKPEHFLLAIIRALTELAHLSKATERGCPKYNARELFESTMLKPLQAFLV